MSNVEMTTQQVERGGRRWSEPVRLGEVLARFLAEIESRGIEAAMHGQVQAVVQARLRKAG